MNISSILCIRYASWIFSKILKALLIWWVKENNGLGISARKEEILRSVRFAKYEPSNFRQQFKLEHNMFSSWVFGLFVGFVLVFFNSPFFFFFFSKCPQSSTMRWLCPVEQVTPPHTVTTHRRMKPLRKTYF